MSNSIERWFDNKKMSPFNDFSKLEDSFARMFNELNTLRVRSPGSTVDFTPSCDISEDASNYTMKFDLPGVPKEQVKVEVDRNQLTVHAERQEEKKSTDKKKHLSEIYYGSYTRSFTLPSAIDEKKVDAKFLNGVLTIVIPKTETTESKKIAIQ